VSVRSAPGCADGETESMTCRGDEAGVMAVVCLEMVHETRLGKMLPWRLQESPR